MLTDINLPLTLPADSQREQQKGGGNIPPPPGIRIKRKGSTKAGRKIKWLKLGTMKII